MNVGTGNESNTHSKLSIKQANLQTGKHLSSSIRASKEKAGSNKYASCSPGVIKPAFNVNQSSGVASNTASKSNRVRSKKI